MLLYFQNIKIKKVEKTFAKYVNKNTIIITKTGSVIKGIVNTADNHLITINKSGVVIPPHQSRSLECALLEVEVNDIEIIGFLK